MYRSSYHRTLGCQLRFEAFASITALAYSENSAGTGGALTVSDATHSGTIALLGQYVAAGFSAAADQGGGAIVTYVDPATNQTNSLSTTKPVA